MVQKLETIEVAKIELDRLADVEKRYSKMRGKHSLWSAIGEAFIGAIKEIPALAPPDLAHRRPAVEGLDEEEFWLDVSDTQIGSKGPSRETGGLAAYSYEVFLERLERWKLAITNIRRYHPNPVRVLNIALLGDIIEGSTIFEGQLRQIEEGAAQQVIFAVEHLSRAINELSSDYERVNVYAVVGNHGRIGKKGVNAIHDNLDYLCYRWMAERLSGNPRIAFSVPESYWAVVERVGHRHLLVHGDRGIRGWGGIPFYGFKRFSASMHELLRTSFEVDAPFEYIHLGHFSRLAQFENIFANGSWDAGTELSVTEMVSGGVAFQWMLALHRTYGVSWSRRLHLTHPTKRPRMKIYK